MLLSYFQVINFTFLHNQLVKILNFKISFRAEFHLNETTFLTFLNDRWMEYAIAVDEFAIFSYKLQLKLSIN